MTAGTSTGRLTYIAVAALMLAGFAGLAAGLWTTRTFADDGPLSFHRDPLEVPLPGGPSLDEIANNCKAANLTTTGDNPILIVGGEIDGRVYYACYALNNSGGVWGAKVVDAQGRLARRDVVLRSGAWPWIGTVKTKTELALASFGLAALFALSYIYYRRARPGRPSVEPWTQNRLADAILAALGGLLFVVLLFRRSQSRARRTRLALMALLALVGLVVGSLAILGIESGERVSVGVTLYLAAGYAAAVGFGRTTLAPPEWNYVEAPDSGQTRSTPPALGTNPHSAGTLAPPKPPPPPVLPPPPGPLPPSGEPPRPPSSPSTSPRTPISGGPPQDPGRPQLQTTAQGPPGRPDSRGENETATTATAEPARSTRSDEEDLRLHVTQPGDLPTFSDVGGMNDLKVRLDETVGLMLAHPEEAERYAVRFNGVLLHGPPGVGKSFFAKAVAGEFGLQLISVSAGDLISSYVGQSSRNIARCFEVAAKHVPCVLFFDEFDSVAIRREDEPSQENRRAVNQLLQSIEQWRTRADLIVMAASNHLDQLDQAVIRPGRFDLHIRIDLPDLAGRQAILATHLDDLPTSASDPIDFTALAERTAGLSAAAISAVVQAASLEAYRETTRTGTTVAITTGHLERAIANRGGQDRPTVEDWSWDRLVIDPKLTTELLQLTELLRNPDLSRAYGVDPPSGLLLAGPPGTGKTTIARVLAAEAGCSFYPVTAGDLTSKWVGESEAQISRLFQRARANAPSIIFVDEIDAVGSARGMGHSFEDRQLTQLLAEIDGMDQRGRVLVIGATNRPDVLDPALIRPGRLSRTVNIGLPDRAGRLALLERMTRRMPLDGITPAQLADRTPGCSGAELEGICAQAAIEAMSDQQEGRQDQPAVTADHFHRAQVALSRSDLGGSGSSGPSAAQRPAEGGYL